MWFKVDDGLHKSRKFTAIPKRVRWAAMGVWVVAGSWCGDEMTDGFVPAHVVAEFGFPPAASEALVKAGLWEAVEGGFQFWEWTTYQPTKRHVTDKRAADAERLRNYRAERKSQKPLEQAEETPSYERTPRERTSPRPDPTSLLKKREDPAPASPPVSLTPDSDVEALCHQLHSAMKENGFKPPEASAAWRRDAAAILQSTSLDKAANVLRWATQDRFWRAKITSMAKFQEHYPKLRLDALADWERNKARGRPGVSPDGELDPDDVLGKDYWVPSPPEGLGIHEEIEWKKKARAEHDAERLAEAKRRLAERGNPAA